MARFYMLTGLRPIPLLNVMLLLLLSIFRKLHIWIPDIFFGYVPNSGTEDKC